MPSKEYPVCEGVTWLDVTDPTTQEMTEIGERYQLEKFTLLDCMEPDHLPKYDEINNVRFIIVRFFAHSFDKRIATIQDLTNKIAVFYTDRFLITIHKPEVPFLEAIQRKYQSNGGKEPVTEIVIRILRSTLHSFNDPVHRLFEQIDFHESNIVVRKTKADQLEALYYIKSQASILSKILLLMLEPINHVPVDPGYDGAMQDVRDEHLKMQTLYAQVLEESNNLMNLYLSYTAQRTNDVMKILTIFSVFFMPLTFIAGIYGMNFKFMPELNHKWGYPATLVAMVLITIAIYLWFRRKKWL